MTQLSWRRVHNKVVMFLAIVAVVKSFNLNTMIQYRYQPKNIALQDGNGINGGLMRWKKEGYVSTHRSAIRKTSALHCICINCSRVVNCQAYHFVETKHEQPHMAENPTFKPREGSPSINVHIRTVRNEFEKQRMDNEMDEQEKAFLGEKEQQLSPSTSAYELSEVMTEYDVVACEDYDEDMGAWVRNMPEEIRLANPDFVPT